MYGGSIASGSRSKRHLEFSLVSPFTRGTLDRLQDPPLSLNGRTNKGKARIYAMAATPNRRICRRFSKGFKEATRRSPKIVVTDKCNAIISAVRATGPRPSDILDDYHLNTNRDFSIGKGDMTEFKAMNNASYHLRPSPTHMELVRRVE